MTSKILQVNFNHSRRAQDHLAQMMAQEDCGIGILSVTIQRSRGSQVGRQPGRPDGDGGIVWRDSTNSPPMKTHTRGRGFVAVFWGPIAVVSIYLPLSVQYREYTKQLRKVGNTVRRLSARTVIVAGDFNAKSGVWGSPRQDYRGAKVLDLAADHDLNIVNSGAQNTCIMMRGCSIVDLTWANSLAERLISRWRVAEKETLSDHEFVEFSVAAKPRETMVRRKDKKLQQKRWVLKKIDGDILIASIHCALLAKEDTMDKDLNRKLGWNMGTMEDACNASMPRSNSLPPRRAYCGGGDSRALTGDDPS